MFPRAAYRPPAATSFCFSPRRKRLIRYSRLAAAARVAAGSWYTSATGRRARVYFAPGKPLELCSFTRRATSLVIPVYRLPSAQRRI